MRLAYLEKIDPAQRMSRFYTICVTPTLFGQWALVRELGRIGQAGAVRENWIESESAASAAGTKPFTHWLRVYLCWRLVRHRR